MELTSIELPSDQGIKLPISDGVIVMRNENKYWPMASHMDRVCRSVFFSPMSWLVGSVNSNRRPP
jgi:hypothetical protein